MKKINLRRVVGLAAACAFLMVLYFGILQDLIIAPRNLLASTTNKSGDEFIVEQYWNRGDFWTLEFTHISKTTGTYRLIIDPDCLKYWRCRLAIDEHDRSVMVTVGGDILGRYYWSDRRFQERGSNEKRETGS